MKGIYSNPSVCEREEAYHDAATEDMPRNAQTTGSLKIVAAATTTKDSRTCWSSSVSRNHSKLW